MMKRQRVETDLPASKEGAAGIADAGGTESRDELLGELAAWCDKELREAAEQHACGVSSLQCEKSELGQLADESFEEFLETMNQDQRVSVGDDKKGEVAQAWRHAVADATRLNALTSLFTDRSFAARFHNTSPARDALKAAMEASTDSVDEWYFALGYELAQRILSAGGKQQDSDDSSDDEPVDDDDSEDEGEEEDESESGSGCNSDSDSD
jgi:hypothetical protein